MIIALIGIFFGFLVGAICRWIDVPVPSPPSIPGALLVLAMTLGFLGAGLVMDKAKAHTASLPSAVPLIVKAHE